MLYYLEPLVSRQSRGNEGEVLRMASVQGPSPNPVQFECADAGAQKPALERSLATLDAETLRQFQEVYGAIRALTSAPRPKRRPIGFTADLDSIA